MGDFTTFLNSLHFDALNTFLIIIVIMVIKAKLAEHNEMYLWYVQQKAIEDVHDTITKGD